MWHQNQASSSDNRQTTIPTNLLKNFNVYDTLEPQKNGAKYSDAQNVEKLIDIDDSSQDSGYHEMNASFFDINKDFTLIDLFQNIFVTPQHIKSKQSSDDVKEEGITVSHIDFNGFFDKLESGAKVDWSKDCNFNEETISERDNQELIEKPRVLVPKVLKEPDLDPEDLIYEVLAQKSIEKQILDEINRTNKIKKDSPTNNRHDNLESDTSMNVNNSTPQDDKFEWKYHENKPSTTDAAYPQIDNSPNDFIVKAMIKDEKVYKKKRIVKPENQTSKFTKGPTFYEKTVVLPQIMARMVARQKFLEEKSNIQKRLILDNGYRPPKAECNIDSRKQFDSATKFSETAKVKAKPVNDLVKLKTASNLCANLSTVKINKPVSLPVKNNVFKASTSTKNAVLGELSPVVLMADCNKERLRDFQQSQAFKNFVLKGTKW